jgi:hypothetical protein
MRSINLLILYGKRKNCIRSGRHQSLYKFIRRVITQTVVLILGISCLATTYNHFDVYTMHFVQFTVHTNKCYAFVCMNNKLHTTVYSTSSCQRLTLYADKIVYDQQHGIQNNSSTTDHKFCICQILCLKRKWNTMGQ